MSMANSPFKFLDSYRQADSEIFFGREKETSDLYNALSGVKHLLVYGPSGSGKTSLVECGLRNQFSDADWYAITIRRGADINAAVFTGINGALIEKIELDPVTEMPVNPQIEFGQAIEKLFSERYQPVYLLFDQFEELLISGETTEKKKFFTLLNKLIRNKVPCRIMLIMREEFIGHLSEFEELFPSIFQHRFRVEKMGRKNVEEVIYHMLEAPGYRPFFRVEDSRRLAESILSKLPDKKKEIELAHVQVFLGELWDRAQTIKKDNDLPVLNAGLVHEEDNLEGILEVFLKKQMTELEGSYGEKVPLELLAAMISEKFTKLQLSEAALQQDLAHKKVVGKKPVAGLLKELEQRRIIRTIKVGDETQYEISHDVLALVVGQNLTEEMKMREKAGDIYKVYQERKGLYTQDDIDYLRPFQNFLAYPPTLQQKINSSLESILEEQKRQQDQLMQLREAKETKKRLRIVYSLLGLAILAIITAGYFWFKTNNLKTIAEKQTALAILEKNKADSAKRQIEELLQMVIQGRGEKYDKISRENINKKPVDEIIKLLRDEQSSPINKLIVPKAAYKKIDENQGTFVIWIDVPSFRKKEIKEVEYTLCRGFAAPIRTASEPSSGFSIGYLGWGLCSVIQIKVILHSGREILIPFELRKYLDEHGWN